MAPPIRQNRIIAELERKRQKRVVKLEALQDAIFKSASVSTIATDANGVIQIFNFGAERMLGYAAADVIDKLTPADLSDPQELLARAKALSQELKTPIAPGFEALVFKASRGLEDIYELTYIRKDGTRFPAVLAVSALRNAAEKIIGYLLIGTDNTVRKLFEAEQERLAQRLRDSQFYTRSLLEANPDALMTTDPSGIITDVNKQMEALTAATRDELIGAPFKQYFTDPERAAAGIKQVLSEKTVRDYELTARSRDGKQTVVSYNAATFYDRDRTLQGVFAAARDVTERKRLDAVLADKNTELESARKVADKANLAKSEFLSSMSHELRSPLNAILGFSQLMESEVPAPSPSQLGSIQQILKAGWYLLKLVNQILDLSAVESGKLSMSVEPVGLAEVFAEARDIIGHQATQRGLTLTFATLVSRHFVLADRTRLKQVLINLLSNAVKYNRQGGSIDVEFEAGPERTRISVRDTGAGLGEDELPQLFQAFNRLGHEGGTVEGTGIGLVMSKMLVEMMGGVMGVDSRVGTGSTFWFELATSAAPHLNASADATATTQPREVRGPQTVLYIEDNQANLELVAQLIARHPGLALLTATTAEIGIELAREHLPQLVLMDVNLPGMNGYQALQRLQRDPSTAGIPVLAISANAMAGDIKRGLAAGFVRYLTKPINVVEFMRAIDEVLNTQPAVTQAGM
ncbi:MAG: PAS domain S-box protein [Myxococcales bacterium]|nr:PAS domain S-box protein [Myxococcales bacterium]MDP3501745.1 PAS domain S-box protein [Myxococcales bacterium]